MLVDAGLSAREIVRRLASRNITPDTLDLILVTHEHSDHISALPVLTKRYHIEVAATRGTLEYQGSKGRLAHNIFRAREFPAGAVMKVGGLTVSSFQVSHDASDPVGYRFEDQGAALCVASDLGTITQLVRARFMETSAMVIESNHDLTMLKNGPYPWDLKKRIEGKHGHLSNLDCSNFLCESERAGLQHVVLAHLSEINNQPDIAYESAIGALSKINGACKLDVASQYAAGEMITVI